MQLSPDQDKALKLLNDWYFGFSGGQTITLGGYAGTGKTTLISIFRQEIHSKDKTKKVVFCSFTGKATRVLEQKLKELKAIIKDDEIGTIHSMVYSPRLDKSDQIIGWDKKEELEADLIIVDEASMVNQAIWSDLLSYNIPILAVGDHGQLPAIEGKFNLMDAPKIVLQEVHRQAKDNPIISISMHARETGFIPPNKYTEKIIKMSKSDPDYHSKMMDTLENYTPDSMVLCGFNLTRIRLNRHLRSNLGYEQDTPDVGDRVICLKNNYQKRIYNGMLGTLSSYTKLDEHGAFVNIEMDGESALYKGTISTKAFNLDPKEMEKEIPIIRKNQMDIFDFGYAMTVHKAQGSQAKKVILFEERFSKMDDLTWRRWLYTAVTRASEELIIFGN